MNSESTASVARAAVFTTSLLMLLATIGCGSSDPLNRQAISGEVSVDGVPLPHGLIRFVPQGTTAGPGAMAEIVDGQFCFSKDNGPIPGNHRVEVEATQFHGFAIDNEAAYAAVALQTGRPPLGRNPIPAVYNGNSILTAFVQNADARKLLFDLRSEP